MHTLRVYGKTAELELCKVDIASNLAFPECLRGLDVGRVRQDRLTTLEIQDKVGRARVKDDGQVY